MLQSFILNYKSFEVDNLDGYRFFWKSIKIWSNNFALDFPIEKDRKKILDRTFEFNWPPLTLCDSIKSVPNFRIVRDVAIITDLIFN